MLPDHPAGLKGSCPAPGLRRRGASSSDSRADGFFFLVSKANLVFPKLKKENS